MSTNRSQIQAGLIDPRITGLARQQAARRTEEQGTFGNVLKEGIFHTVPQVQDVQGILTSGDVDQPVASGIRSQLFPDSLFVSAPDILDSQFGGIVSNLLETGVAVDDALYSIDLNDVACTENEICNKRISYAGPERSAGRPGHTPIRRELACGKHIEDRVAGQDWSAGQPGIRPFDASTAACPSSLMACLGPYGTAYRQPHHTGPNTREEKSAASSSLGRPRHQKTSQPIASTSRRSPAAEDRTSSAMVALHPHRLPYFCGGVDEDVHVWTSIVSHWLEAVQGEPSKQLTYVVSLLRGVAIEWYTLMETHTGCPGDWTTLRNAMLECFRSSIHAGKARTALLQMTQGKMTVLEYFDVFESYLAQLEDYDESFYLAKFIFGLQPGLLTQVFAQHPATLLEAKVLAKTLELTQSMVKLHQSPQKKTIKTAQHRDTQRGDLAGCFSQSRAELRRGRRRRLAVLEIDFRDRQIRSIEATYPLI